jgi:hypothetical protein
MRKITITDPRQVKVGDKAYFKDCDFGFTVNSLVGGDERTPFMVINPLSGRTCWTMSEQFDHATREVKEPEWPDPHDLKLHVYLGADGKRYIYNPVSEADTDPWSYEGYPAWNARKTMETYHCDALPLTELKLVPVNDDGSNDTGITIVCNLTADPEKHTTRRNNA